MNKNFKLKYPTNKTRLILELNSRDVIPELKRSAAKEFKARIRIGFNFFVCNTSHLQ